MMRFFYGKCHVTCETNKGLVQVVFEGLYLHSSCLLCIEQCCTEQEVSSWVDTAVISYETVQFKEEHRSQSLTCSPWC